MLNNGINNLWSTPLYKTTIDQELCDKVLSVLMQIDTTDYANGKLSLLTIDDPAIKEFKKEVTKIFSYYFNEVLGMDLKNYRATYKAWAITARSPSIYSMPSHNHASSPFESVFYLFAQDTDLGGELVINDPRANANRGYMIDFQKPFAPIKFKPTSGDVVVFPGYAYHSINPFLSDLRVAVPVDLFLDVLDDDEG